MSARHVPQRKPGLPKLLGARGTRWSRSPRRRVLIADFGGQAIAEFLEEISDVGLFLGPIGGIDAQQFFHRLAG